MSIPSLDDVVAQMQAISGAPELNPDQPLLSIEDIDSLDMMEWLYEFQESYPEIEASEAVFEDMTDATTFRHIYEELISPAIATSKS